MEYEIGIRLDAIMQKLDIMAEDILALERKIDNFTLDIPDAEPEKEPEPKVVSKKKVVKKKDEYVPPMSDEEIDELLNKRSAKRAKRIADEEFEED